MEHIRRWFGQAEGGRLEIRLSTGRVFIIDENEADGTLEVTEVGDLAFPTLDFIDISKSTTTVL